MKTTADLTSKLQEMLSIASMLDPKIALAAAGVDALKKLFAKNSELSTMMDAVYAETVETAPDVAREVSDYYAAQGDAMLASFRDHPGT